MPAPLASEALRAGPGRHPVHFNRLRFDAHARDSPAPCMGPVPSAPARCAAGLHGMTLEKERHAGAARKRSLASGTRPAPMHLATCSCVGQDETGGEASAELCVGPGLVPRAPFRHPRHRMTLPLQACL